MKPLTDQEKAELWTMFKDLLAFICLAGSIWILTMLTMVQP